MPRDERPVKLVRRRLDAAGVEAHLRELATTARELEVRVQGETSRLSAASGATLDAVARRLIAGEIAAAQIRFRDGGDDWWCDTVMRAPHGFRLVRMREGS